MTHNADLQRVWELIQELNAKMDKYSEAMLALGEIVHVENKEQAYRDDKMLKMIQAGQTQQKRRDEEFAAIMNRRDELLSILTEELAQLGPLMAHAAEQITAATQKFRDELAPKKKCAKTSA